ncbi:MAG: agmatinase [Bacteroidales bacterium]|nr:agmatinase [Bacteroidales bacterium]
MKYNFGGLEEKFSDYNSSNVVVLPIPYDGTSTWIKGADKGPDAILEASANMELYDIEYDTEFYTVGIHTLEPLGPYNSPEQMAEDSYNHVKKHISNKFIITLGGEHSISYGPIKAHAEEYGPLTVLQLDAHSDLREEYEGSKYNHACIMARAKEFAALVQVGIRSQCVEEANSFDRKNMFFAHELYYNKNWIEDVVSRIKTKNVYITIDLDVFDPSIMPSTGTPEPGGLLWYETLELLEEVFKKKHVVGFDVVELCPNVINKAPNFLAAKLIYKMIGYKFFI